MRPSAVKPIGVPSNISRLSAVFLRVYPIEDMPALSERIGQMKVNRIRHSRESCTEAKPKRSNCEKRIVNTVLAAMQGRNLKAVGCPISDVLSGIARLDHHSQKGRNIPLSTVRLYTIFQCIEVVCTREVMELLGVGKRQAMHYVRACELALPFLKRAVGEEEKNGSGSLLGVVDS